jgi:SAM-dependent methyltransferase
MQLGQAVNQYLIQEQLPLEAGFLRYQDYLIHGDKHDVLERHLAQHLPGLLKAKQSVRMLDIGVGTGMLTRFMVQLLDQSGIKVEIVALEPSRRAGKCFKETMGNLIKRVDLQLRPFTIGADLDPIPYDLVLASHVCYYFEDKEAFVEQVMNSIRDGGFAIFVATSISIMQNPLYQTILQRLREKEELPRTFASDGSMSFVEEIENVLFDKNVMFEREVLPSHITFSVEEIAQEMRNLKSDGQELGPVLKAISFLWRYPPSALLSEQKNWQQIFMDHINRTEPLTLLYEDIAIYAFKGSFLNPLNRKGV